MPSTRSSRHSRASSPTSTLTEVLRAPYLRYVDDFALFDDAPARLADWRARAAAFLARRRLSLHPAKTPVAATVMPGDVPRLRVAPGRPEKASRKTACGASATGCAGCATAGMRVR